MNNDRDRMLDMIALMNEKNAEIDLKQCLFYNKLTEYEDLGSVEALKLAEQLDEPSREECELISNEYNICSCCSYNLNNLIKEIVVGCDTDDCECGRAVVHQVFWTDKYMNYCPNCGAKIKIGEERCR